MGATNKEQLLNIILIPIFIVLAIILSPIIIISFLRHYFIGLILKYRFKKKLIHENKHILFAYSDSPHWKEYIENNIEPVIADKTIFINRSQDSEWKKNNLLESKVIKHWGGDKEYNPIAIIFPRKGKINVVRFYQAFKDYKHGNTALLNEKELELYEKL